MNFLGLNVSVDRTPTATVRWTRRAAALGVANLAVIGGGLAFANWSANGVGTVGTTAGTSKAVTAPVGSVSSTGATALVPGGSGQVAVTINNPNAFPVKVSSITITGTPAPASVSGAKNASCTTANSLVTLAAGTFTTTSTSIPANSDGTVVTNGAINPVSMGLASDDGCQSATFTFAAGGVTVAAAAG
jgi:hypothetical protein